MKVSAIICAAGTGERAGFGKNKLLATLYGAPALYHTLRAFDISEIDEVIVTSSAADYKEIKALCAPFGYNAILGGKTRFAGVKKALEKVTGEIILIHDGARPFVTKKIITDCIAYAKEYGSAVCATPVTDTMASVYYGVITDVPKRETVYAIQTPQGFLAADIKKAYEIASNDGIPYTDDSSVYANYIGLPHIFEGDRHNVKLTYREDFLKDLPAFAPVEGCRTGIGADTHAFGGADKFITLGGVKIECGRSLVAHSDGDVVLHAVTDAVLSASGLKDIGHYFPDTDKKYKGADSGKLLGQALEMARGEGFSPVNVSVTIQAESPKLAPYIDEMTASVARLCGIDERSVAIAAGTSERLGFVGEGLGIVAYAAVLMRKI